MRRSPRFRWSQVAIKTSLDIFYFHVQFDLSVALTDSPALSRDEFTPIWQRVGEAGQKLMTIGSGADVEQVKSKLQALGVAYVAQRQTDSGTVIYTSALTSNNCSVLGEA